MIKYTKHAEDRMHQRQFSKEDVKYCLENYHTSYIDETRKGVYRVQLPDGRKMRTVANFENDDIIVITVADE